MRAMARDRRGTLGSVCWTTASVLASPSTGLDDPAKRGHRTQTQSPRTTKGAKHDENTDQSRRITLAVAVPAFLLGPLLFPPAEGSPTPTAGQMPFFLFLGVGDAVLLGLGVVFLIFGLPVLRKVSPDSRARAWAMYLSIGYLMVSWWPHLNMHASNGLDLQGLLFIDYFFHLPLEIAGVALAYCFFSLFRSWRSGKLVAAVEANEKDSLAGAPAR